MATIQLGTTKSANRLISYAEKRAEVREGVDCPSEYAKSQMNATRRIWGKTDGIQAHHVIQSFKPGEVTPEQANEIGRNLAKEIAKGHECVVYTHTDKEHIHNHIVINSVNYENGSKYQAHGNEAIERVREASDRLCMERGLSVVKEKSAELRHTLAEQGLLERGETSWKEEIRKVIDHEKTQAKTYDEFKHNLKENYGVDVLERGKNITFTHPDNGRKVRGSKLGNDYEKETIKNGFERQIERKTEPSQERGNSDLSNEQSRGSDRAERDISRLEEFSKYAMGQKRFSQESVRANDERNSERNEGNTNPITRTLETNTAEKQRNPRTIDSSAGEQQRSNSKGSKSSSESLPEKRERNGQGIGSNHEVGTNQRTRKENGDKGKASTVRNHSRVERPGLNRSEPPMDGSNQVKKKDKSKDRGMDFDR